MKEDDVISLLFKQCLNKKHLLTNFIVDTVINDAYVGRIIAYGKRYHDANQLHQPIPMDNCLDFSLANIHETYNPFLITGSSAESLSVPPMFDVKCKIYKSDSDIMYVIPIITCDLTPTCNATLLADTHHTHSGYCNLVLDSNCTNIEMIPEKLVSDLNFYSSECDKATKVKFLRSSPLPPSWLSIVENENAESHGPAQQIDIPSVTSGLKTVYSNDIVISLRCLSWPAKEWIDRQRSNHWPTVTTIQEITEYGCHVVPVAHAKSLNPDIEWRFSFSLAELILAKQIPNYTRKVYIMFKLLCKTYLENCFPLKTYYLKTILFWCCEEHPELFIDDEQKLTVKIGNMAEKLDKLIEKLLNSILKQELASYFISTNNLFDSIDREYFSASQISIIVEKIEHLRKNPMQVLFETVLEHYKLDHCLPFYFNIRDIFEPVLKHLYNNVDDKTLNCDVQTVVEQLSISFFLEGRPFVGRKLLQTIWYKYLECLPINDLTLGNLITEHNYYTLVHDHYQELLLDKMINVQEKLLNYFSSSTDDINSSQNIVLLRSLGYLYYMKSNVNDEEKQDIESKYFRKSFDISLITTADSQIQKLLTSLDYGLYLCQLERYDQASVLLKDAIAIGYDTFNDHFVTIYSLHKSIHPKDIQYLLCTYNAVNISTKTYIYYLLCRCYRYTNRYDERLQILNNLIHHILEIRDIHTGIYLVAQLCLLYNKIEDANAYFTINLYKEYELKSIFEPSKTMILFKASLVIVTCIQVNSKPGFISVTTQSNPENRKLSTIKSHLYK